MASNFPVILEYFIFFNRKLHFISKIHTDSTLTFWHDIINVFIGNLFSFHHFCAFSHLAS